jgi:hypothetical protein
MLAGAVCLCEASTLTPGRSTAAAAAAAARAADGLTAGTVTGVQLAQGRSLTAGLQVEPTSGNWGAYVLARPHCEA